MTQGEHLAFIKQCEDYIGQLKAKKRLIAAQPVVRKGCVLRKTETGWTSTPIDTTKETHVGYYHILAENIDEAIEIAKQDPEFSFVRSATIEVRPLKTKEVETSFEYPK